ncbi:MAG: hypothetical protein ACI9O3_001086 [Colwellia sp.]|jgi:hypothetical protein
MKSLMFASHYFLLANNTKQVQNEIFTHDGSRT